MKKLTGILLALVLLLGLTAFAPMCLAEAADAAEVVETAEAETALDAVEEAAEEVNETVEDAIGNAMDDGEE